MDYGFRSELMSEFNMLKGALSEAEDNGEVSRTERVKIMGLIGQIKSVLYADVVFKEVYTKRENMIPVRR